MLGQHEELEGELHNIEDQVYEGLVDGKYIIRTLLPEQRKRRN